jgi:predicted enzyme related to lactoylglutathione lyase
MNRVSHFEINADDPDRAVKFYSEVFGWEIKKWDGPVDYWLITTGSEEPGINGGIAHRRDKETTVVSVDVPSVDEFVAKIEAAGGTVLQPKTSVKGVGYMAYCSDTGCFCSIAELYR